MTDQPDPNLVGGRYQLGELLGRGGMAEVRKATDTRLGRTVAVKRLRTDLASDATFQTRFRREAQSAAALNHPAIVAVYDTGEEVATDVATGHPVAQPYIVMEYVAGRTLRDILQEGRKILPERALEITSGVLSALDYSHRAGIIHRDIKPGNVMLTGSGEVKVMDFGIARAISDAQSTMTQTAAVVGTAQYLSPEQARGETVDARSDVYSTGCLLFELLTGRPPFVGESPVSVAYQHVREEPPRPSEFDADLDPALDSIVLKALSKRVEDRYQSAAAMKDDIDRYLAGRPVVAPPVPVHPAPAVDPTPTAVVAPMPADDEPVKSRSAGLVALGVLLALLVIGAAFLIPWLFRDRAPDQASVPKLIGLTQTQAEAQLAGEALTVGEVTQEASAEFEAGQVIRQHPDAGSMADIGSAVDLVLSSGPPNVEIPPLIGSTRDSAEDQLKALELKPVFKDRQSDQPAGEVVETKPEAGASVAPATKVTVFISTGPKKVPDVRGMMQAQAEKTLKDAGFTPGVLPDHNSTAPKGTVTEQVPVGIPQVQGTSVTIMVSVYEPPPEPEPTQTTEPTEPTEPPETP